MCSESRSQCAIAIFSQKVFARTPSPDGFLVCRYVLKEPLAIQQIHLDLLHELQGHNNRPIQVCFCACGSELAHQHVPDLQRLALDTACFDGFGPLSAAKEERFDQ